MYNFRVRNDLCSKNTVLIAVFRWHQAVGGEQDRSRKISEFLLLVLPCGTEVALKMGIFTKLGISMGRKHLTVSVDIDSFVLRLFKQLLQIVKVMAGDNDERPFFNHQRNCDRSGIAIGQGVGLIKHLHALEVDLTDFENDRQQFIHTPVFPDREESLGNELIDRPVGVSKYTGVICICRHTADPKQNQRFEAADIFLCIPDLSHIIVVISAAG